MSDRTKVCHRCLRELPIEKFGKDRYRKDGRNGRCLECLLTVRATGERCRPILPVVPIDGERWLPIPGFQGIYDVSDMGRVRHCAHRTTGEPALLPQNNPPKGPGYPKVHLRLEGFYVHRLVTDAFLGPCPVMMEVNHKNGIKADARLENLEYVSSRENKLHAHRLGLAASGERSEKAILKADQVRAIRRDYLPHVVTQKQLAERYGVAEGTVGHILKRRNWRDV